MKAMMFLVLGSLVFISHNAFATITISDKSVKTIICQGLVDYEEDQPDQKTPSHSFMIFSPGSRPDVKVRPNAFLKREYNLDEQNKLTAYGTSQYYFSRTSPTELHFEFIANWKSSGTLHLESPTSAKGFINTKGHVTNLTCAIEY